MIELIDTNSPAIAAEFVRARTRAGSPAMGMVMTLVIVVDEDAAQDAMEAARESSHEHPARVLGVILGDGRGHAQVNAQVGTGSGWGGETALIRLKGEIVRHPESVVLPLLLPDSPVVVWWPAHPPDDPAADPLGALAQRRITDAAAAQRSKTRAIHTQCSTYAKGNTDLAWTRITPWRALLAAALDQQPLKVRRASVTAERISPSAELLKAWLSDRLKVPVERHNSAGPGITEVTLETKEGPIRIAREDGKLATYSSPGRPDRPVALKRRTLPELLAEELRRLDEDDIYKASAKRLLKLDRGLVVTSRQVFPDAPALAGAVAEAFLERMAAAQAAGEVPHVGLTGGTIAEAIHEEIASRAATYDVDWSRVVFWWGDERFVAPDSSDRNARQAREAFLDRVGATQVHEMPSTATAADVDAGAAAYADELRAAGSGAFDLVMLGLGPDGHVASLFPGFPQLDVDDAVAVGVTGSPKPPPERITLTYGALNRTQAVWFLVSGEGKADAVARATAASGDLHDTPARGITPPADAQVVWFLDAPAASRL